MKKRDLPMQVWALAWDDPSYSANQFVGPALDDDGTESFLAFPTKEQAKVGAQFQLDQYDCKCHPVLVAWQRR